MRSLRMDSRVARRIESSLPRLDDRSFWWAAAPRCVASIAASLLVACSAPTEPTPPQATDLTIEVPQTAVAGDPFSVTVRGSGAEGTVTLSATSGVLQPGTIEMVGGVGMAEVRLTGTFGEVTVRAVIGDRVAEGTIGVVWMRELPADPGQPAASSTPAFPYEPRDEDYSLGHPEAPGVLLSHNTLVLLPQADATVGQVNALLDDFDLIVVAAHPGAVGVAAGILVVRASVSEHAEAAALRAALAADPRVAAVTPEFAMSETLQPKGSVGRPPSWSWSLPPAGGNWGMEAIRAPQSWNLMDAVVTPSTVLTGIVDNGYASNHEDLLLTRFSIVESNHGTHVAGTIGARFGNGKGVEGVNPFAAISAVAPPAGVGRLIGRVSWVDSFMDGVSTLLRSPNMRVINMSLGFNWAVCLVEPCSPVDANNSAYAQAVATSSGFIFDAFLRIKATDGLIPVIVAAAGNDSGTRFGLQSAMWASPMNNAALVHGNGQIVVVEALALAPGSAGGASRAWFSDIDGHISAPGQAIMSTMATPVPYDTLSGTSMAAPHVTGLIGYLLALDPTLSVAEVRDLLLGTSVAVAGGASPRIDAFASALAIDELRGSDRILRSLVDIDDGSLDGNQRVNPADSVPVFDDDIDGDGALGDGRVDMADFRRFRDWLLQVEDPPGLDLDGAADHIKRDLDRDSTVADRAVEAIFARADFNGDGRLSRGDRAFVGSVVGANVTDLEVLQALFADADVAAADLPGLLESGDVHVSARRCLTDHPEAVGARSWIEDGVVLAERPLTRADSVTTYTLPASGTFYLVGIEALDADGAVIGSNSDLVAPTLGGDALFEMDCPSVQVGARISLAELVEPGTATPLLVRAGFLEGRDTLFEAGLEVALLVTGGTADVTSGVTDSDGFFSTELVMASAAAEMNVFATVTDPVSSQSTVVNARAVADRRGTARVFEGGNESSYEVLSTFGSCRKEANVNVRDFEDVAFDVGPLVCPEFAPGNTGPTNTAEASGSMRFDVDSRSLELFELSLSASGRVETQTPGEARVAIRQRLSFVVEDAPMRFTATGSGSLGGDSFRGRFQLRSGTLVIYDSETSLGTSGTLPPGGYEIDTIFSNTGRENASGSMSFRFTVR